MKKLKLISGVLWAVLCLVIVLVLFPGLNAISGSFARLPFMKINPNYTGGEIARHIIEADYSIDIRKPVFDGLAGERRKGFVQVDWRGEIPEILSDTIDYDLDDKPDFSISILKSLAKTEIRPISGRVGKVLVSTPASYGWVVRVEVIK
jgi:hypothetical protein